MINFTKFYYYSSEIFIFEKELLESMLFLSNFSIRAFFMFKNYNYFY